MRLVWAGFTALVLAEIGYPLVDGVTRARLTVVTVLLGYAVSVLHAAASRGWRAVAALVLVVGGGGLAVEALGVATGVPFGSYGYSSALGPQALGVPLVIPLAWTWMAWPAWLVAGRLVPGPARVPVAGLARVPVAGLALAAWDLFLDPQMVAEGYWAWRDPRPALPGVSGIPISNYLGWLLAAVVLMALLATVMAALATDRPPLATVMVALATVPPPATTAVPETRRLAPDAPMYALYLWTYASGVLAHAVFLHLPASAVWGGLGMGFVAVPLAVLLSRRAPRLGAFPRRAPRYPPTRVAGRPPHEEGRIPG
ncbi:MAG TPA: carotenoid biosynthesis protein [Planosporangium sp.]|nr:carotenoid biosynthesis protein [Planosporangium sp.]